MCVYDVLLLCPLYRYSQISKPRLTVQLGLVLFQIKWANKLPIDRLSEQETKMLAKRSVLIMYPNLVDHYTPLNCLKK
jgi:hypothetical protein